MRARKSVRAVAAGFMAVAMLTACGGGGGKGGETTCGEYKAMDDGGKSGVAKQLLSENGKGTSSEEVMAAVIYFGIACQFSDDTAKLKEFPLDDL